MQKHNEGISGLGSFGSGIIVGTIIGTVITLTNGHYKYFVQRNIQRNIQQISGKIKSIVSIVPTIIWSKPKKHNKNVRLYLIRHAEIDIGTIKSYTTPLNNRGVDQANSLGKRLANSSIKFDAIYSSSADRAYDTGHIVKEHLDCKKDIIVTNDVLSRIKQKESYQSIGSRVINFLKKNICKNDNITNENSSEICVGIFMHELAIKCLIRDIQNSDFDSVKKLSIDNASITELFYDSSDSNGTWKIIRVNDHAHCASKTNY